jgi:signal transduction histidine kinase
MQAASRQQRIGSASRELLALLAASIAVACVLTASLLSGGRGGEIAGIGTRQLLVSAVLAGAAAIAGVLVWAIVGAARRVMRRAQAETARLRRNLVIADAIIKSEPQVLVSWEPGRGLELINHSLTSVPGLPETQRELLRFGGWLDPAAAAELKSALDTLFASGRGFNLLLKTAAGGHLEAYGRAAGSRAILRLRDVAAYKRDLVKVLDQHRQLTRDIRSSRALLDALPLPVWLKGSDGRIEWANKAYIKAVEAADLAEVKERQHELLESRQRAMVARALGKGEGFAKRLHLIINGERKAHDVIVLPVESCIAAAAIDVAALETAQGELNRQITAYDRTLDRVTTAVAIFNRERRLTFFNDAYRKLWQLDAAWLDKRPADGEILDRLHELSSLPPMADYRRWKAAVLASSASGAVYDDWWQLPDGRMLHVMAEQRHDGGITYLYDDATERLALESSYNALIGVQRETLDSLKEGVAVFAPDGRLKLFNSAFAHIWRLSREMLRAGPHIDEIIAQARVLHADDRAWLRLSRAVTAVSDEREPDDGQMVRADMSVIDFATAPLPDGATLVTFADVTASKQYERALLERNEALIAADRLKSQFISHVSYELRTPLTNIIGFSELLASARTGPLNSKQREYLADISASSTTLLSIIDDILDLATIEAGALELKLAPVAVSKVIEDAILGVRERAMRARLTLDIASGQDDIEFIADESRVRQVLYNLLSNAIGFSKPGGTVRLSYWREDAMVVFAVEDEGVGIPKEQQTRVFDRFESRSQGSRHRGAGLGLSIVKSLVEAHGGDMNLVSEPGRGTRVTVRFPERGEGQARASAAAQRA